MPVERRARVSGGFEVFGDQGGVFVTPGIALFDDGGHAPVQLGAPGLELGLVGDGADERVPKRVFGVRGEPHLVDQFDRHQLGKGGLQEIRCRPTR